VGGWTGSIAAGKWGWHFVHLSVDAARQSVKVRSVFPGRN